MRDKAKLLRVFAGSIAAILVLDAAFNFGVARASSPSKVGRPVASDGLAKCKTFVQSFYDWYGAAQRKSDAGLSIENLMKQKKNNFTAELSTLLLDDAKAQSKAAEEIVGLDFDPVLATNAEPAQRYVTDSVRRHEGSYRASVYEIRDGKRSSKPVVEPDLIFDHGLWKFSNFYYIGGTEPDSNLIKILKTLKKDRKE